MEEVDKLTSRQVDESELHLVDLASGSWLLNLSTRSLVNLFTNKIAFNNKFFVCSFNFFLAIFFI
jgi:hypothetical protein